MTAIYRGPKGGSIEPGATVRVVPTNTLPAAHRRIDKSQAYVEVPDRPGVLALVPRSTLEVQS